jgi:hypothetical protein
MSTVRQQATPLRNHRYLIRGAIQCILCACMLLFTSNCNGAGNSLPSTRIQSSAQIQSQSATRVNVQPLNLNCSRDEIASTYLVEGQVYLAATDNLEKPDKGVRYVDPAHGTCVARVTDHFREQPVGFARNDYSRRQAFNSDNSLLLVHAHDGYWHLYNANDLSYVRKLDMSGSEVEPQWDPHDPSHLYLLEHNGGMTIRRYDVRSDSAKVIADFRRLDTIAGYPDKTDIRDIWPNAARLWTRSEGSPSADARYWGLMVETDDFHSLGMITYDLKENTVTGVYDFSRDGSHDGDNNGNNISRPDHVSMSPSGEHIVASWYHRKCESESALGSLDRPCGLMSYSRDFSTARGLAKRGEHSDIAFDNDMKDVVVMANYESGYLEMYSLDTGETTRLWKMYIHGAATALHVSGKSYQKPGWVLVSTYATNNPRHVELWFQDKILAVELKENPRVYGLAHTYDVAEQYFSEPHAVVNRDFTRILFNSNWMTGDFQNIDTYMIQLPPSVIPSD